MVEILVLSFKPVKSYFMSLSFTHYKQNEQEQNKTFQLEVNLFTFHLLNSDQMKDFYNTWQLNF